jgi:hypothetical protein
MAGHDAGGSEVDSIRLRIPLPAGKLTAWFTGQNSRSLPTRPSRVLPAMIAELIARPCRRQRGAQACRAQITSRKLLHERSVLIPMALDDAIELGKIKRSDRRPGHGASSLAHACDWDHTSNEPVGSVDRSGHR